MTEKFAVEVDTKIPFGKSVYFSVIVVLGKFMKLYNFCKYKMSIILTYGKVLAMFF